MRLIGSLDTSFFDRTKEFGFDDPKNCIFELIDNSIDAKSTKIHIILEKNDNKNYILSILDNGKGMDENEMENYYNFGGNKKINNNDLGSKGMGSKLATSSLSDRTKVDIISKKNRDSWVETHHNWKDDYIQNITLLSLEEKTIRSVNVVTNIFTKIGEKESDSFTLIRMNISPKKYTDIIDNSPYTNSLEFKLSTIYSNFINNGININVFNYVENTNISIKSFFDDKNIKQNFYPQKNEVKTTDDFYKIIRHYEERKFILINDLGKIEIVELKNNELFLQKKTTGANQSTPGKFSKNEKYNKTLTELKQLKNIILTPFSIIIIYNNDFEVNNNEVRKYFCNSFCQRNDKLIPIQQKKNNEFFSNTNYRIILSFKSNNHYTDNLFGTEINKSEVRIDKIDNNICKVINTCENDLDNFFKECEKRIENKKETNKKNFSQPTEKSDKKRISIPKTTKQRILSRQQNCELHTGTPLNNSPFNRVEFDHKDGNPSNNNDDNIQAITPNLHSLKSNNSELYQKVIENPELYVLNNIITLLSSSSLMNNKLSDKDKNYIIICNKELKKICKNLQK